MASNRYLHRLLIEKFIFGWSADQQKTHFLYLNHVVEKWEKIFNLVKYHEAGVPVGMWTWGRVHTKFLEATLTLFQPGGHILPTVYR